MPYMNQPMNPSHQRRPVIAVCGSGQSNPPVEELAYWLGYHLVTAGCTLISGGMFGVMEAASRGGQAAKSQKSATGLIVGILPGAQSDQGNSYCDVVIPTGLGPGRNLLVVMSAEVVILVGGGSGTLSEAALAWQMGKPLIALTPSGGWAERLANTAIDSTRSDVIIPAATPEAAVAAALTLLSPQRYQQK